jgi:hypothetical protein
MKAIHFLRLAILFFYTISCAGKNHGNTSKDNSDVDTAIITAISVADSFETGKLLHMLFVRLMQHNLIHYIFQQRAIKKYFSLFIFSILMVMVYFH